MISLLCTIDVVGLYLNISYKEGLKVMKEALNKKGDQTNLMYSLIRLAESALKNHIFEHDMRYLRQL